MAKSGPLGKAESFYVEEKFKSGDSITAIAKDLDRAESTIDKYIKKNKIMPPKTIVEQQFVRQGGATIMTENASSMLDAKRNKPISKQSDRVTKIR